LRRGALALSHKGERAQQLAALPRKKVFWEEIRKMAIVYEELMALKNLGQKYSYSDREVMLYAYGIGLGADPMDEKELAFVNEGVLTPRPLKVVWQPTDGAPLPFFTLA